MVNSSLFVLKDQASAKVISCSPRSMHMEHSGYRGIHKRNIELDHSTNKIVICDEYNACNTTKINFILAPEVRVEIANQKVFLNNRGKQIQMEAAVGNWALSETLFSRAYGFAEKTNRLALSGGATRKNEQRWQVEISLNC